MSRGFRTFTARRLALSVVEETPDFLLFGDGTVEIVVIRLRDSLSSRIPLSTPPALRENVAVKCSFEVADLAQASAAATAAGGGTKPLASAWLWRGERHLDGHDPEGNVVQFRQRVTS